MSDVFLARIGLHYSRCFCEDVNPAFLQENIWALYMDTYPYQHHDGSCSVMGSRDLLYLRLPMLACRQGLGAFEAGFLH